MKRREFLTQIAGAAAASITYEVNACASQTCAAVSPYVTRCTAGIRSEVLSVTAFQQASEWCWAACIEMVFTYYKHRVPQRRIVEETWGSVVNMPGQPEQILADLNRDWTDERGKAFTSTADSLSADVSAAVVDLKTNKPLIIGALGHATVLTALTSDINNVTGAWQVVAATVRDPWPANGGRRILSPQEWYNINFAVRITIEDGE